MKSMIVLCGGRGKRMGQDKGLMILEDEPLIVQVLENASELADEIILVLRSKEQQMAYECILEKQSFQEKVRICTDAVEDQGPLMGICAGLKCISTDHALVIPCDSPFIPQSFIRNIFNYYNIIYDAVVPEWPDGKLEPLHAIYNKRITGQIEDILKDGKRDVQSLLLEIDVRYFPVYSLDETAQSFLNLNYPEDVDRF
ncbi:MAG: molybdenum cofactor guanylyltransferase [Methanobacteriaceae archaeon]|jgi:molybdopterin-guanine dinucleotide biosynthesis protein A|nr:molybdenum cofactor guanylyltransferase [Methanobacteriaceae archaeon]OPY24567.1 MAG: molybdopterin-guanine dinucleotide biosynthesis protein MobA [Methanobacterium sp. PtaU1.Bin097]